MMCFFSIAAVAELRAGLDNRGGVDGGGRLYKAKLRGDKTVSHAGKVYSSLTAAAVAVMGRHGSGRWFWHYERSPGDWVRLREKLK